jgi:hypothetical protein
MTTTEMEFLGLDNPKLLLLIKEVAELMQQIEKATGNKSFSRYDPMNDRACLIKLLRAKSRALSSLCNTLIRLNLELIILKYE